jgi:O-antigen ligase
LAIEDGSPVDRAVFLTMIVAALFVLARRKISLSRFITSNVWLVVFIFYCGISIAWSDFPFVAFKRWIKAFGDIMMVMILLSDPQPLMAIETMVRRCAYIFIPVSVLFIKFYPQYGRVFSEWGGGQYTGIALHKTFLGYICYVGGLYLIFLLFGRGGNRFVTGSPKDVAIPAILLCMVVWLMKLADAKTSVLGLVVSSGIALGLGTAGFRKYFTVGLVSGLVVYVVLEMCCDVKDAIVALMGRDATWTGRGELWPLVLAMVKNPIGGEGFESFWLGERLRVLHAAFYFKPNQAHNGYLEMYLNLGWVGLTLLAGVILSCYTNLRQQLLQSVASKNTDRADFARWGMAFLVSFLIFNITDASMRPLNFLFVSFLIFVIKYPQVRQTSMESSFLGSPYPARIIPQPVRQ